MKYYVASDIHGFFSPFRDALTEAGYFDDPEPHKLILLGDLFDRGREAVKLQEFILDLMGRDQVILIRGNHEDLFEQFVTVDEGLPYQLHRDNGTYSTALQLTGYDMAMAVARNHDFAEAAMKTPYYQRIMPAMIDYYETRSFVFVHGWIPTIFERGRDYCYIEKWRECDKQAWAEARWINGMMASKTSYEEKTVVCGHWHASFGHARFERSGPEFGVGADFTPYYGAGIIAIDACTSVSGFVNVIVLKDTPMEDLHD